MAALALCLESALEGLDFDPRWLNSVLERAHDQHRAEKFSRQRYMQAPCSACGKVLIEYLRPVPPSHMFIWPTFKHNLHLKVEHQFTDTQRYWSGYPVYKCGECVRDKRRSVPTRHLRIVRGYCCARTCAFRSAGARCLDFDHYSIGD